MTERKPRADSLSESDDGTADKGFRKFSSVLSSVWSHGDHATEQPAEDADDEEEREPPARKAVDSMGTGDVSLDDFSSSESDVTADGADADGAASVSSAVDSIADDSEDLTVNDAFPQQQLANNKKNSEFHKLFPKLPKSEPLIEEHSCALSRDILTQGKLYISPHYLCFYSNILGWQVTEIINLSQVVEVQAKSTFGVFPNGMTVVTLHQRHTFASLLSRDGVVDLITKLWKSPLNKGATRGGANGGVDFGEDDEMVENSSIFDNDESGSESAPTNSKDRPGKWPVANLGPDSNKPTALPEIDSKEKVVANETVNAPLGVVANLIFGKDTKWYHRFLADVERNKEVPDIEPFKDSGGKEKRHFEYIKPLNSSIGPKQTKCVATETIEDWNLKEKVTVVTETRTPDVPSGNAFTTMTRLNMSWGPNNTTKLRMSTWIDWTGKSWIKSAVEKGALDGQVSYAKNLVKEVNATLSSGKQPKPVKIKMPSKGEEVQAEEVSEEHVETPGMLGQISWMYVSIALSIISLFLLISLLRTRRPSELDSHLRTVEQEYYLWQWIDGRMPATSVRHKDLVDADVKEAIRVMETRLHKLKSALAN